MEKCKLVSIRVVRDVHKTARGSSSGTGNGRVCNEFFAMLMPLQKTREKAIKRERKKRERWSSGPETETEFKGRVPRPFPSEFSFAIVALECRIATWVCRFLLN